MVNISVIDMSDKFLHVKVDCVRSSSSFLATFLYGLHTNANSKYLGNSIKCLGRVIVEPWIVLGDFTSYLINKGGCLLKIMRLLILKIVFLTWNWLTCKVSVVILHG